MALTLERRVELGNLAKALLIVVDEEITSSVDGEAEKLIVLDRLIFHIKELMPDDVTTQLEGPFELTPEQARKFEQVAMPFGIHKDAQIKNVPYEYLCNLFDPNPFMKKLKKYLEYCAKYRYRS